MTQGGYQVIIILPMKSKMAAARKRCFLRFLYFWGVLTLTWYTYRPMCLPFGALFRKIWYSDWGVFIRDEGAQIT